MGVDGPAAGAAARFTVGSTDGSTACSTTGTLAGFTVGSANGAPADCGSDADGVGRAAGGVCIGAGRPAGASGRGETTSATGLGDGTGLAGSAASEVATRGSGDASGAGEALSISGVGAASALSPARVPDTVIWLSLSKADPALALRAAIANAPPREHRLRP